MDSNSLIFGLLFGTIGFGFFIYGKKQQRIPPLIYGIALMVLPYAVPEALAMILTTVGLTAVFGLAMRRGY